MLLYLVWPHYTKPGIWLRNISCRVYSNRKCFGSPGHPDADGVTVIVAITGVLPALIAVNAGIFPLPLAAKPIEVLLFVQLKSCANVLVNVIAPEFIRYIMKGLTGCTTSGVGLTVMVNISGGPLQPNATGVTVIVAVTGALVILIAVNEVIFPFPLAARPIEVLLFVQLKIVPLTEPMNVMALVIAPAHFVWLGGGCTFAVGLTVIVKDSGVPGQVK